MGGHSKIDRPWEVIATDIVGPLPKSSRGFSNILVVTDCFSKFCLCFPLRKATAESIIRHLEEDVFLLFGVPRRIISDNGVQFRSNEYRKFLQKYHVYPSYTAYYHPQANPTERVNRVVKSVLIAYVSKDHRSWDECLPKVACAIRTAVHETTGLTPYFVNFGREMKVRREDTNERADQEKGLEIHRDRGNLIRRADAFNQLFIDVKKRLDQAYASSKRRYDLRHRELNFYENQLVWRKNFVLSDAAQYYSAKLADKYLGPFMIRKRVARDIYTLKGLNGADLRGEWHVKDLKPHPGLDGEV